VPVPRSGRDCLDADDLPVRPARSEQHDTPHTAADIDERRMLGCQRQCIEERFGLIDGRRLVMGCKLDARSNVFGIEFT
jgi:hypothetical protein